MTKIDDRSVCVSDGSGNWTWKMPPPAVGGYVITPKDIGAGSKIIFMYTAKPNWWNRLCVRFFLGWRWEDV